MSGVDASRLSVDEQDVAALAGTINIESGQLPVPLGCHNRFCRSVAANHSEGVSILAVTTDSVGQSLLITVKVSLGCHNRFCRSVAANHSEVSQYWLSQQIL